MNMKTIEVTPEGDLLHITYLVLDGDLAGETVEEWVTPEQLTRSGSREMHLRTPDFASLN